MPVNRLRVRLFFVRGEDVIEFSITTTKERINDDVGIVMQAAEEGGYHYLRGEIEEECDGRE